MNWNSPWLLGVLAIFLAESLQAQVVAEPEIFPGGPTEIPEETRQQLRDSLAKWLGAKAQSGGNYRYQVTFSSFSGFRSVTTITATRGVISKRAYEEFFPPFFNIEPRNYVEEGNAIGTHSQGAPPLTVDELYEIARQVLENPLPPHHRLALNFDDLGLLKNCFTYNTLIADDVPINGVRITNLTLLPRFPSASDSDSDQQSDQASDRSTGSAVGRIARTKRLRLALREVKRIQSPRKKRAGIKRLRKRIRELARAR